MVSMVILVLVSIHAVLSCYPWCSPEGPDELAQPQACWAIVGRLAREESAFAFREVDLLAQLDHSHDLESSHFPSQETVFEDPTSSK